jgi:hypothetical protein
MLYAAYGKYADGGAQKQQLHFEGDHNSQHHVLTFRGRDLLTAIFHQHRSAPPRPNQVAPTICVARSRTSVRASILGAALNLTPARPLHREVKIEGVPWAGARERTQGALSASYVKRTSAHWFFLTRRVFGVTLLTAGGCVWFFVQARNSRSIRRPAAVPGPAASPVLSVAASARLPVRRPARARGRAVFRRRRTTRRQPHA